MILRSVEFDCLKKETAYEHLLTICELKESSYPLAEDNQELTWLLYDHLNEAAAGLSI